MVKNSSNGIFKRKSIFMLLNILLIVGLAGTAGYFYKKYDDVSKRTPEQLQQAQTDAYITAVSKLYSLPKDEKPSVLTVSDKEAAKKDYPSLDQAENGDVLLVYKEAKLAILYRPSEKKLVKVVPVTTQLSIKTIGSDTERKAVEQLLTNGKVAFTSGGSTKTPRTGILIVDLKGSNGDQAKQLAEIVKGSVGSLPEGEEKPADVDLLIIVGPAPTVTPDITFQP